METETEEQENHVMVIGTSHGRAEIFFSYKSIDIVYRMTLSGKSWILPTLGISLRALSYYGPGPLAFLKSAFYRNWRLPPVSESPEDQKTIQKFNSFVDDHGQSIIDKARELGLMENENQT